MSAQYTLAESKSENRDALWLSHSIRILMTETCSQISLHQTSQASLKNLHSMSIFLVDISVNITIPQSRSQIHQIRV